MFNMQNAYALENIIDIANPITISQSLQTICTIQRHKLTRIVDVAKKYKQALYTMSNGYSLQVESQDYANLNDLIECYKAVTSQVNEYYNTNLQAKLGYKAKVTFWEKTREVIKDAMDAKEPKIQTVNLKQQVKKLKQQVKKLKQELNKCSPFKKQQINAIKQMNKHLIYGQFNQFFQKHSKNQANVYNHATKKFQLFNGYLFQYNINEQILQSISNQFVKFQKLQEKLKDILQVGKNSYSQKQNKTITERCEALALEIQQKMKANKDSLTILSNLEQAQKKIIMGTNSNYHNARVTPQQKILAPVIEEYKIIKSVLDKLKNILTDQAWPDAKLTLAESCKNFVYNLQDRISETASKIHQEIGSGHQGSIKTMGGLLKLMQSMKTIFENKSKNYTLQKTKNQQNLKMQLQRQILRNIDEYFNIEWSELKKKININDKNRIFNYTDQIIIRSLQLVRIKMQIPNRTLIDYMKSLIEQNQKLRNKNSNSEKHHENIHSKSYTSSTQYGKQHNEQEQSLDATLQENERLNQQIKKLTKQKSDLDEHNKLLLNYNKQYFDQYQKNKKYINTLEQLIKQNDKQLGNMSHVSNVIASNSNSEKDQKIYNLQKQVQYYIQRKQVYKNQCLVLNAEVGQLLSKANALFKDRQSFHSITQVYEFLIKQYNFVQQRRQFYKLKCQQNQIKLQQSFQKIQKKINDPTVSSFSDLQNIIQKMNENKINSIQNQKILQNNLVSLKSIQSILNKNLQRPQVQSQNQTQPLSQYEQITSQIISQLNSLFQPNIKQKTIKFKDRSTILANTKEEKFIVQELTNYLGDNSILRFNLLYRYSQGGSLAEAIAAHPNTVLIIKTKFDVIIACYSSLSYCQTVDMRQRKGLLIETHTNSSYCLKSGCKPVEYDENNLIFGNKVIKISKKERNHKIQIDFNQKNSVFENKQKHTLYDLFKSTEKLIQFEDFQLYEIEQKNNQTVVVQRTISQSDPIRHSRLMEPTKSQERTLQSNTSVPKNNTSKGKVSIRELTQQVEKYKKNILTLKKENETLKKKVEQLESAKDQQKNKSGNITITNLSNRNTLTAPTGFYRTTSNESQQTQLQKQMDEMTKKMKNTEQSLLQKSNRLTQAQNKIKQQENEIKQLTNKQRQGPNNQSLRKQQKDELENVRKQKQQVQKKLLELQIQHNKQKEEVNKKIVELQNIKKQLEETVISIQRLKNQNQKTITELKQEIAKLTQEKEQNIKEQQQRNQIVSNEQNKFQNTGHNQQTQNFSGIRTKQSSNKIIRYSSQISQQSGTRSIIRTESGFNINEAFITKRKKQLFMQKVLNQKIQPQTSPDTYKEIIQKLKTELNQYRQTVSKQKQQNNQKVLGLQRQKQKLQGIIKSNNTQLGDYYRKTQQLQKQIKKLKEGSRQLLQVPSPSKNIPSPSKAIQSNSRSFNQKEYPKQLKKEVQQNKKLLTKILQSKNNAEKECTQKQADLFKINQKHKKDTLALKQLQDKMTKLKQEQQDVIKLMGQLQARKRQKEQLDYKIKQMRDQIRILDQSMDEKRRQTDKQRIQINKLKGQKQVIFLQNKKMEQIIQSKTKQFERISEILRQIEPNQKRIQQNIQSLKEKQQQQRTKTELAIKEQEQIKQAINKNQSELNIIQKQKLKYGGFPNRLFVGDTLSDELDRQYIIDQVQKLYSKLKIANSRLLFTFPLMRNINPHETVDGVPNYIIVMKLLNKQPTTKKHYILAMYSEKPLVKGAPINNGLGFVSAVTNQKTFYLRNTPSLNPRLTEYNEFYFIFGNSQFRFRINSDKIQISVGHNFRSLDTGDIKTPQLFAGTTQTNVQIISYEIYQLQFGPRY